MFDLPLVQVFSATGQTITLTARCAMMEFDYIIVGAGSAGCVLADRLSRRPDIKVLILEAGGSDRRFWIRVPLGYGFTFSDPRVNWCYTAQADAGINGREGYWPRGRVIGGSSSINAMAYVRGLAHDFNDWARAGATGWNWDTVRETYERMECHIENGRTRGDGPVLVSDLSRQMHPFSRHFLTAAGELGWPVRDDMNESDDEGLSYYRSTVRNGRRWSAADAFLRPALKRGNIKLVQRALVERLEITGGRATGVRYRVGDSLVTAQARAEVILSAGAINSPQLLQLSGIGPAAVLKSHGIEVVRDLGEVGQGLQDHLAISRRFSANVPTLNNQLGGVAGQVFAGMQYLLTRRGPLGVPVNQVGGFVRSGGDQPAPDMQIYCNPASYSTGPGGRPEMTRAPGFVLSVQPCRPTSRGSITIASTDPKAAPVIRPNALSTERDRDDAVRAGRLVAKAERRARHRKGHQGRRGARYKGHGRCRLAGGFPRPCRDRFPPDLNLPDGARPLGFGAGRAAAGAWGGRASRGRRLGLSQCDLGQHQCTDDHAGDARR